MYWNRAWVFSGKLKWMTWHLVQGIFLLFTLSLPEQMTCAFSSHQWGCYPIIPLINSLFKINCTDTPHTSVLQVSYCIATKSQSLSPGISIMVVYPSNISWWTECFCFSMSVCIAVRMCVEYDWLWWILSEMSLADWIEVLVMLCMPYSPSDDGCFFTFCQLWHIICFEKPNPYAF